MRLGMRDPKGIPEVYSVTTNTVTIQNQQNIPKLKSIVFI
jgi:hypothetical protein